ncbi:hypothetical protein [Paenisporosarcina cavernae]|uniref:YhjD n=1 Tax=Paenisporosarcina cavernae TaxID=2320858 RepID=A0A385YWS0_9BACL|nr:hypothetical protein [Paenisporosarcina cavernae]AYC30128.1 hypothetical protein D3873_09675 [Paenisporosarcina cavernae]
MPLLPEESLPYFENLIYLPMVLTILERDRLIMEKSPFKLKRPYMHLMDHAIKEAQQKLKESKQYARNHRMQLLKGTHDDTFTEYVFNYNGFEDRRRYLNVRLRNRVEELIAIYLGEVKQA